jgi:hypothetical protein
MKKTTILALVAVLAAVLAIPAGAQADPAERVPISGTTGFVSMTPGEIWFTPSGVMHEAGAVAELWTSGDIEGFQTCYYSQSTMSADGDLWVARCSTVGEYTWNGRTGPVTGTIEVRCTAEVPYQFSCGGPSVLHGSGELEGVTFRFRASGQFPLPFTYEGYAIDTHR